MNSSISTTVQHVMHLRKKNVWYTLRDGNWNDPAIWMGNAANRRGMQYPNSGDDVFVNHSVTLNGNFAVNNLYGNGAILFGSSARTFTVNNNVTVTGTIDMSNAAHILILKGAVNKISGFVSGSSGTVTYSGTATQQVENLIYRNLSITGKAVAASNITTMGTVTLPVGVLDMATYNLSVGGATTISNGGNLMANGGNLTFGGLFSALNGNTNINWTVGNPNVEYKAGLNIEVNTLFQAGSGSHLFSSANQTITPSVQTIFQNFTVAAGITVSTGIAGDMQHYLTVTGVITAGNSSSTLNNNGLLYLCNSSTQMAGGVFNYNNNVGSALGYLNAGTLNLPYSAFAGLYVTGSTIATATGNITASSIVLSTSAKLECGAYNVNVSGLLRVMNSSTFSKTGAGAIVTGNVNMSGFPNLDLSGNPTWEFKGDSYFDGSGGTFNSGTGQFKISATCQFYASSGQPATFNNNVLISGAVTVTIAASGSYLAFAGVLDGDNVNSVLDNRSATLHFKNAGAVFPTLGKLYANQAANTIFYDGGAQDVKVPGDAISAYRNLTLAGTGAKRLLGNISVVNTYTLTAPATLDNNGYALTNP